MKHPARVIDFRHAPPSRWTCIARPDDPFKTVIREDGTLLYDYVHPSSGGRFSGMFHTEIGFKLLSSHAPLEIEQRSDDARNSIVVTILRYRLATLTLTTFGHLDQRGRRTDVVLWSIRARPGARQFAAALAVLPVFHRHRSARVAEFAPEDRVLLEDAPSGLPPPPRVPFVIALNRANFRRSGEPMDWYNFAAGFSLPPAGAISRMALLDAGETFSGAVLIPQGHQEIDDLNCAWAERALTRERRFWRQLRVPRLAIEVADPEVQRFVEACARNILQAREIRDGLPEFQVGPTCYRNLWVCDGFYLLQMARYLGLDEEAERGTRALLRRVKPDGAIYDIKGHTMETIISVATLVRQAELSGDRETLRGRWPVIRNAIDYIRGLRREARALDPTAPEHGLLPRAYPDGGIGGTRAEYLTTLWTLAGFNLVERAARWLGERGDAERVRRDFDELMRDFREHARREMRRLADGTPYLRMLMRGESEHVTRPDHKGPLMPWDRLGLGSGAWAFCQAIYTGEVFAPDDPLVLNLLKMFDQIDNRQGLPEGMGWLLDRSLWTYGPAFAAQAWLYARRPDKAADYLYAFANHAAPTRVWREEQSLDATLHGHTNGDMPHNWASAEFIHLVRNFLVCERGDRLDLLAGLPSEWTRPGSVNRLRDTPTRFGKVSVSCRMAKDGAGRVDARISSRTSQPLASMMLRLPPGTRKETVVTGGRVESRGREVWVCLEAGSRHLVTFRVAKGRSGGRR